jgi:uncharacterized protein
MKVLAFTDHHDEKLALAKVREKAKDVDFIICGGDITNFGSNLKDNLEAVNNLGKPVLLIQGNHEEHLDMVKETKPYENITYLHATHKKIEDTLFLFYGGGGLAKYDSEFKKVAKVFQKEIKDHKKVVLVLHGPPHGTKLDELHEMSTGNFDFRNFIEKNDLTLVICGHIEENSGREDYINKTKIVNPGPYGKVFEI